MISNISSQTDLIPPADNTASPLVPENDTVAVRKSDEENEKDKKKDDKEKKDKKDKEEDEPTVIDLEGMESRVVILPVDAGNIGDLAAVKDKVIYIRYPNSGDRKSTRLNSSQ